MASERWLTQGAEAGVWPLARAGALREAHMRGLGLSSKDCGELLRRELLRSLG